MSPLRSTFCARSFLALALGTLVAMEAVTSLASPDAGTSTNARPGPSSSDGGAGLADGAGEAGAPGTRTPLDEHGLDALLSEISMARARVSTLRSNFTQERTLRLLATRVISKGTLTFVAPDRLRWELLAPDDVIYWIGPEGLSFRTRSSRATLREPDAKTTRGLSDLRALLGGDLRALRERYVLEGARGPADVELRGTAKDPKAPVKGFALVLDAGLALPRRARILEGQGEAVELTFHDGRINAPVDPREMRP